MELSETERLKLENLQLKIHILQQQLQQLANERDTFIKGIEDANPGYVWDEQKGFVKFNQPHPYQEFTPH